MVTLFYKWDKLQDICLAHETQKIIRMYLLTDYHLYFK